MSFEFEDIRTMTERSILFETIKQEMIKRGHWKYKNRGSYPPQKSQFSRVSIHPSQALQISVDNEGYQGEFDE